MTFKNAVTGKLPISWFSGILLAVLIVLTGFVALSKLLGR